MPRTSSKGTCKYCGLEVRWVTTPAGRNMPLDVRPSIHGDVVVDLRGGGRVVSGPEAVALRRSEGLLHVRHQSTCPSKGAQLNLGGT